MDTSYKHRTHTPLSNFRNKETFVYVRDMHLINLTQIYTMHVLFHVLGLRCVASSTLNFPLTYARPALFFFVVIIYAHGMEVFGSI